MKNIIKVLLAGGVLGATVLGCVPARKYQDEKKAHDAEKAKAQELHSKNVKLEGENKELENQVADMDKRMVALKNDTSVQGTSLRQLTRNYDQLNKTYQELLSLKDMNKRRADELVKKIMAEIEETRTTLQSKEDKLNDTERALAGKEADLKAKIEELNKAMADLDARAAEITQLQSEISRRDSLAKALEDKIRKALFGLEKDGITMEMRNGKVYISLDNELLFKPGSYMADEKGKDALKKLAKALKGNDDINITVEGHTDSDKYGGGAQLKDNWDLSVKRATSVVRILQKDFGVDPKRMTAAGRAEFVPVSATEMSKNRRTRIVVLPKIDQFYNMIEEGLKDAAIN